MLLSKLLAIVEPGAKARIFNVVMKQIYPIWQQHSVTTVVANLVIQLIKKNPEPDDAENYKKLVVKYAQGFANVIDKASYREIHRFASFLSFYIHSLDCEWPWDALKLLSSASRWTEDEKTPPEDPRKAKHVHLLKLLVADLQQLCYAAKLLEVLPREVQDFVCSETVPFKYTNPEEIGYSDAQIILDRIKEKVNGEQLTVLIRSSTSQIESEGELLFDIVVRCVLSLAQYFPYHSRKSMEHMHKLTERYHTTLIELIKGGIEERRLFDIMFEMYRDSEILVRLAVEKFAGNGLMSGEGIIKAVFKHLRENTFSRCLWAIVTETDSPVFDAGKMVFGTVLEEWEKMAEELKGAEEKLIMQDYLLSFVHANRKVARNHTKSVQQLMSSVGLDFNSFPL